MKGVKQVVSINVYGKDKEDLKNKIKKIYFLISFLKEKNSNIFLQIIFFILITLFLIYIIFGIYISGFHIYSNQYIDGLTKEVYYYDLTKKPYTIQREKIVSCGALYCLLDKGKPLEKPLISNYIIK